MYNLQSCCSLLIHLVLKHPILVLAMGLVGLSIFLMPLVKTPTGYNTEWAVVSNQEFVQKDTTISADSQYINKMDEAERWFQAILSIGKGDPGITKSALKDLERLMNAGEFKKLPDCPLSISDILHSDNETKTKYARIYLYDQMRRFKNPELAVLAYRFGPTNTAKIVKNYKAGKLKKEYKTYLKNVKIALKDIELSAK